MKLYDFHCDHCGKDFEDLVRDLADARCPACASADVKTQLSRFAVGGAGSTSSAPASFGGGCAPGGCCGGGACGVD